MSYFNYTPEEIDRERRFAFWLGWLAWIASAGIVFGHVLAQIWQRM